MEILSVGEVARILGGVLEAEPRLRLLCVRGELGSVKAHPSGHFYFTLKDESAQIRGVMFRSRFRNVAFSPKDGDMVLVTGQVAFYQAGGQVQIYAEELEQLGLGAQLMRLKELKARLEAEGLFRPERKRPLPLLPRKVGIVTSSSGAALRDILQITRRRHPGQDVVVAPARVQGQGAAAEVVRALRRLAGHPGVDVIIVGRGGGSQEDLDAFNDEALVRAVAACPVPVVSAVGHETDFTLVDFAADQRAPTPSAAAELAVPVQRELALRIWELRQRLGQGLRRSAERRRDRLAAALQRWPMRRPQELLLRRRERVQAAARLLGHVGRGDALRRRARLQAVQGRLGGLDPRGPLRRGYAMVTKDGRGVTGIRDLLPGDRIEVHLADGQASATIEEIESGEEAR
jgi:exodeoxyribonuclease VII large subunit